MRVSELSRNSGVSIPTIKYYLREGLLARGDPTARNQAEYSDFHLRRLRLIRALAEIGGMDLKAVRRVLDAIDDSGLSLHEVLGVAQSALRAGDRDAGSGESSEARVEVDGFIARLGWRVSPTAPARGVLVEALVALRRLGREVDVKAFEPHAEAAYQVAGKEVERLGRAGSRSELVEAMVVGTVVFEAVLVALRLLAHEHHSALRFAGSEPRA